LLTTLYPGVLEYFYEITVFEPSGLREGPQVTSLGIKNSFVGLVGSDYGDNLNI
jgi:hypothetical protein